MRWRIISPSLNPKAEWLLVVIYLWLLSQYICGCPPYLEAVSICNPRMCHATVAGTHTVFPSL